MRLDLTADQRLLQSATAGFLDDTSPITVTRALHAAGRSFDRDTWRRGTELGWASLLVPEDLGGGSVSGAGLIDATIIAEQFGAVAAPAHAGLLKRLIAGEAIGTWACCPPGGGWDPSAGAIEAVPDGDGYRHAGVHEAVEAATDADVFLVLARAPAGLTQLVVPAGNAGLSVAAMGTLDLTRGFGRVSWVRVTFRDCRARLRGPMP